MVEPEKKNDDNKEQWKIPEYPPPLKSRRKIRRGQTTPLNRTSFTSISSLTGEKSQSVESIRVMSDEPLVRDTHSTGSLPSTSLSLVTMTGPSPPRPEETAPSEISHNIIEVDDEPEIKITKSSISLKLVRTPSRNSLLSAISSSELKRPSEIKFEKSDSLTEVRRRTEMSSEFQPLRTSSHQRMSDIQIIENPHNMIEEPQTNVSTPKHPKEAMADPRTGKSVVTPGRESVVLWKSENTPEPRQSSGKPVSKQSAKRTSVQSLPEKVDNAKTSIIEEYKNIIETIKQQNNNLEKIKRDMLSITTPSLRKGLEKRYFAEEDKLNDELVKAMVLQSRCPYERWPEIPVVPNIYDDYNGMHPYILVNKARQHISNTEQPERKVAGEVCTEFGEATSSDESSRCSSDPDSLFKDLLDKIDKLNGKDLTSSKSSDCLNTVITNLLKKRKSHINHCAQCDVAPKNCRALESIDEELCRLCKTKLNQLKKEDHPRKYAKCDCEDLKSSKAPSVHSRATSSSEDDRSMVCGSNQDFDSLEDEQLSAIINLTQIGKPKKPPPLICCKIRKEDSEANSKKKVKPVSSTNASSHTSANARSLISANARSLISANPQTHSDSEMVFEKHKLKEQLRELKAERDELKFIIREQECQMFDYQNRYLEAKQEIEEQVHHIYELEKCNECIEDQINCEMRQIQVKFEQNLKHLQECLEIETRKMKQCCKEKEELREKLNMCCAELHKKNKRNGAGDQHRSDNIKLANELQSVREIYKHLEKTNALQKEEIKSLKLELATLRRDTTAILSRSKERVQRQIADFNKRIYELEDELAKERAHSCCAIKEKDRCCKLLESSRCENQTAKAQLKTLQAYVKTLCSQLELQKSKRC